MGSLWRAMASRIMACISSQVSPALTQPGTSGT